MFDATCSMTCTIVIRSCQSESHGYDISVPSIGLACWHGDVRCTHISPDSICWYVSAAITLAILEILLPAAPTQSQARFKLWPAGSSCLPHRVSGACQPAPRTALWQEPAASKMPSIKSLCPLDDHRERVQCLPGATGSPVPVTAPAQACVMDAHAVTCGLDSSGLKRP